MQKRGGGKAIGDSGIVGEAEGACASQIKMRRLGLVQDRGLGLGLAQREGEGRAALGELCWGGECAGEGHNALFIRIEKNREGTVRLGQGNMDAVSQSNVIGGEPGGVEEREGAQCRCHCRADKGRKRGTGLFLQPHYLRQIDRECGVNMGGEGQRSSVVLGESLPTRARRVALLRANRDVAFLRVGRTNLWLRDSGQNRQGLPCLNRFPG